MQWFVFYELEADNTVYKYDNPSYYADLAISLVSIFIFPHTGCHFMVLYIMHYNVLHCISLPYESI